MNKRRFSSLLCALLLITICIFCYGCSKDDDSSKEEDGYRVYYLKKDEHKLAVDYETVDSEDTSDIVGGLLMAMMNPKNTDELTSALGSDVKIIDYSITDDIVYLNFTAAYTNQSTVDELLCRAAFVLTLTQIDNVTFVGMNINGQPMLFKNNTVSLMKAGDFADISSDSVIINSSTDVTLYFANKTGDKLKTTKKTIEFTGTSTMEKHIVEELIKGPNKSDYYRTIPENVKVLDAFTRGGVCYVYFDSAINDASVGIDDDILIYSIVNSLSELTYISKVQIIIDGDPSNKLHETYAIDKTFSRNLDLVENKKE